MWPAPRFQMMDRQYYIALANAGLRMPIGTDLVLHEHADAAEIVLDGRRLGQITEEAACRDGTPLAAPLMDLRLEKADLLDKFGVPEAQVDAFHFDAVPSEGDLARVAASIDAAFPARCQAHFDSIRYIAGETKLVPLGMAIGPFSLMTKLMADPIVPIAMAGMGVTGAEDPSVLMAAGWQGELDYIRYIAGETKLVPLGMAIGPFSLMTKLMADPIVPIAMAGMGVTGAEDPSVLMAERCLALAEVAVHR